MSQTDLIGWGSLALFAVFFALLYRFITTPSRKLEKALGDGRALGLRKLSHSSPQFQILAENLQPFLGTHGGSFRLGSVYQTGRGNGYLFSLVEIAEVARPGGTCTEHQDQEMAFWLAPNRLPPFVIRRKPQNGMSVELSAKVLETVGHRVERSETGLLPEFQHSYVVYGGARGPAAVPAELQQALVGAPATAGPDAATALDQIEAISFTPESFLIHLSSQISSRKPAQLRQLLRLAETVEQRIGS